jgi:hypothetical protein
MKEGPSAYRHVPVELTADQRFTARVARLVMISAVALGVIWVLATATPGVAGWILAVLFAGWLAMPVLLAASLIRPRARYLLVVPAALVTIGLIGICLTALPAAGAGRVGWPLLTAGILLGGSLGGWFWYRWVPVPSAFDAPFSPGRWWLVALHAGLIVGGAALVIAGLIE